VKSVRFNRVRRKKAPLWPLIALLAFPPSAMVTVSAAPLSDIYVRQNQSFEQSELMMAGSATDSKGIASVTVAVKDLKNSRWLQLNGSWGARVARHRVDLSVPGAPKTRWLFRRSLPTGNYLVNAQAINTSGIAQSPGGLVERRFSVVRDRSNLNPNQRWLTVLFTRSIWGTAGAGGGRCSPYTDPRNGSVFLDEIASFMTQRGYKAQGSVPFGQLDQNPAVRKCPWPGVVSASLNDLESLRNKHGWTFVADSIGPLPSSSSDRPAMTALTCKDQIRASAESLAELQKSGHVRGWGLIAPPNSLNTGIRDNITSRFYSYTRLYGYNLRKNLNTKEKALAKDWGYFRPVGGGFCNDPNAACYKHYVPGNSGGKRYQLPDDLLAYAIATPGAWRGIQFYRLVRGANIPAKYPGTPGSPAGSIRETYWDCSSPDPKRHWTSRSEVYCFVDFQNLMNRLPRDVITTDTAHVATTWGIGNPNQRTPYPQCK
jgi:hypothetical protein